MDAQGNLSYGQLHNRFKYINSNLEFLVMRLTLPDTCCNIRPLQISLEKNTSLVSIVLLEHILQKLGLEKVSIVGWSDGGIAAIIMAARFPELVQNIVIWGANAYVTQKDLDLYNCKYTPVG